MPQAGLHALTGVWCRKLFPSNEWLLAGLVIGNMAPDLDNFAVAAAFLSGSPTDGIHRGATHSLLVVAALTTTAVLWAHFTRRPRWKGYFIGLGFGLVMHVLLDLVGWFNGVEVLWPIAYQLNFWSGFTSPSWLGPVLDTAEFLSVGWYFGVLVRLAEEHGTDLVFVEATRRYIRLMLVFFVMAASAAMALPKLYLIVQGALYLFTLALALRVTFNFKKTLAAR